MSLLTQDRFFVRQKAKLIEINAEYAIQDEQGTKIGALREVGQTKLRKVLRFVSNFDAMMPKKLTIADADGSTLFGINRGFTWWKSKVDIVDAKGEVIGRVLQEKVVGKARLGLVDATGQRVGAIVGENLRAWNFRIEDANGTEVGRVTKKWAGAVKEIFTTADNYLVELSPQLAGRARELALTGALAIDTVLKQHKGA